MHIYPYKDTNRLKPVAQSTENGPRGPIVSCGLSEQTLLCGAAVQQALHDRVEVAGVAEV